MFTDFHRLELERADYQPPVVLLHGGAPDVMLALGKSLIANPSSGYDSYKLVDPDGRVEAHGSVADLVQGLREVAAPSFVTFLGATAERVFIQAPNATETWVQAHKPSLRARLSGMNDSFKVFVSDGSDGAYVHRIGLRPRMRA